MTQELIKNRHGNLVSNTHRECTGCGKIFQITSGMTLCKTCNCNRVKSQTPEWKIFRRAKRRAFERKLEFDITISDIVIPDYCPALGLELNVNSGRSGAYKNSPSLDRIDNTKGYIKGNIQVLSQEANAMKHSATTEELILFAKWILKTYDPASLNETC
jgi:predicted  nucleic acid-binding Zn-ribbon protein